MRKAMDKSARKLPINLGECITQAQSGDLQAQNRLIKHLLDNNAMQQLSRYLYKNRLLEPDDVRGEFWLGVAKGLTQVKTELDYDGGQSPLQFLIQKGLWQVQSTFRSTLTRNIVYSCVECGHYGNLPACVKRDRPKCTACGSHKLHTAERKANDLVGEHSSSKNNTRNHMFMLDIELFATVLTDKEREVFHLIVDEGHDRDASDNYLEDIGFLMECSPQCVKKHLNRIRSKLTDFQKRW